MREPDSRPLGLVGHSLGGLFLRMAVAELIAGTARPHGRFSPCGDEPNDGVVAVNDVAILGGPAPLLFPVWRTLLMDDWRVRRAVVAALTRPTPVGD